MIAVIFLPRRGAVLPGAWRPSFVGLSCLRASFFLEWIGRRFFWRQIEKFLDIEEPDG
jgi:hypothetical protein